jgi:hypothetical protein
MGPGRPNKRIAHRENVTANNKNHTNAHYVGPFLLGVEGGEHRAAIEDAPAHASATLHDGFRPVRLSVRSRLIAC